LRHAVQLQPQKRGKIADQKGGFLGGPISQKGGSLCSKEFFTQRRAKVVKKGIARKGSTQDAAGNKSGDETGKYWKERAKSL